MFSLLRSLAARYLIQKWDRSALVAASIALGVATLVSSRLLNECVEAAAYDTTVEASVYCHPAAVGHGYGTALYGALFELLAGEDVKTIVAGISLPNPASISLHKRFGFQSVGVFHAVGRKFDRYWDVAWFERPLRIERD